MHLSGKGKEEGAASTAKTGQEGYKAAADKPKPPAKENRHQAQGSDQGKAGGKAKPRKAEEGLIQRGKTAQIGNDKRQPTRRPVNHDRQTDPARAIIQGVVPAREMLLEFIQDNPDKRQRSATSPRRSV